MRTTLLHAASYVQLFSKALTRKQLIIYHLQHGDEFWNYVVFTIPDSDIYDDVVLTTLITQREQLGNKGNMLAVLGKILYIPLFHSILTTYILHLLQY
jgi:hypothetical protein